MNDKNGPQLPELQTKDCTQVFIFIYEYVVVLDKTELSHMNLKLPLLIWFLTFFSLYMKLWKLNNQLITIYELGLYCLAIKWGTRMLYLSFYESICDKSIV